MATKKTTKALSIPEEFQVERSKISDLAWADKVAANYVPFMNEVQELSQEVQILDKENPQHWSRAREIRIRMGRIRSTIKDS
jgi:hypothetical protein